TWSTKSLIARKKLEAELVAMEEISRQQAELAKMEIEKMRIEMNMALINKRLEVKKETIDEEESDDEKLSQDLEDDGASKLSKSLKPKTKVQQWLAGGKLAVPETEEVGKDNTLTFQQFDPPNNTAPEATTRPIWLQPATGTTDLLGISDDENLVRLQKCLKEKARDAVIGILHCPKMSLESWRPWNSCSEYRP
ncbi:unnamed protein product, partial [Allacma fusca]